MFLGLDIVDWRREPSQREKIYFALVFVILIALFWRLWWLPQQHKIDKIDGELKSLELQEEALVKLIEATKLQVKTAVEAAESTVDEEMIDERIRRALKRHEGSPAEEETAIVHLISSRRMLGGLALRGMQSQEAADAKSHTLIPIKITVEGTFNNILRFLQRLEAVERPVIVKSVQLSRVSGHPGVISAELIINLYAQKGKLPMRGAKKKQQKKKT